MAYAYRRQVPVRRAVNLVSLVVIACLVVFVWLSVARTLTKSVHHAAPVGKPRSLAWGDRVFRTQADLEAWLKGRGISYSVWAARHRRAVGVIEHRAVKRSAPTGSATASPPATRQAVSSSKVNRQSTPRASASATVRGGSGIDLTASLLWAFVLVSGVLAVAPARLLARISGHALRVEQRTVLVGAAASIAVGLVAAGSI